MENKILKNLSEASNGMAANAEKMVQNNSHVDLQELLEENLKYAKAIYWSTEKIRRYMFWMRMIRIIWILVVLAPIIFAAFYLPPLFKTFTSSYNTYLNILK